MKWMEAKKTGGRGKRKKKVAEPATESETDTDGGFFPAGLAGTDEDEDSEASQKLKVGNRVNHQVLDAGCIWSHLCNNLDKFYRC